jgi:prophage tail gpP-like protein
MSFAIIYVASGGMLTGGWEKVSVTAALKEAARSFSIDVTEVGPFGESPFTVWAFPPGTAVTILANGQLLVTGYVNTYAPQGDANGHTVTITGRGKGQDYADCSCEHATGRFDQKKIEDIGKELDVYGIGISAEVDTGPPIPWFQVNQGSSPHQEMLKLAQQRKLTMKGKADGSIVFTKGGNGHHAGGLIQGFNIERMSATLSDQDRFSDYTAKGQSSQGTTDKQLRPKGEAKDPSVKRHRKKIIIDQADTDEKRLTDRATWEAKRAAGFSVKAQITTPSFQDIGGALWEPGWTVFVHAPWLKLEQDMLIESVEFTQDNSGGTQANLSLVDPKAYDATGGGGGASSASGKAASGSQSGSVWDMP